MDLGHFDLDLLEIGDFIVEEVQVRNELAAALEEDVFALDLLFTLNLLHFRLILFQELSKAFLGILFPEITVLLQILLDILSVLDDQVQVVGDA